MFARAQPTASREGRIDGSSGANFEASVAALLNALPPRRREDLELALAVIWTSNTLGPSGLDRTGDGIVDATDIQLLADDTYRLLTEIEGGNLLSTIEERERTDSTFTSADYVKRLDGLGYDQIIDLAGRPSELKLPRQLLYQGYPTWADYKRVERINEAIAAYNLQKFDDARAALRKLDVKWLTPYQRSNVEQILFSISYREDKLAEARDHLKNAIGSGGLNGEQRSTALVQIRVIESRLEANPPELLSMPKFP